jgi:uncharacterized membrane protein
MHTLDLAIVFIPLVLSVQLFKKVITFSGLYSLNYIVTCLPNSNRP